MSINPQIDEFLIQTKNALADGTFVKISLGNYKGTDEALKKIHARRILIKKEQKLSFTYQYKNRDIVKNYSYSEALDKISQGLKEGFNSGVLQTTEFSLQFENIKGQTKIRKLDPVASSVVSLNHDKDKNRLIETIGKKYLHDLRITDEAGNVYKNAQDKYRQINKYIEIIQPLIKAMESKKKLNIVDMGSGKGYLTFALYDYLTTNLNLQVDMTGVEYRADMVDLCNKAARNADFSGLNFVQSGIESYNNPDIDVLIALHACDTATDDAIYKGIEAKADLIVVAPCCHKQIRRQMERGSSNDDLDFLLKHGILMERQAEMVTDGIRSLILQAQGYNTKIFEFISGEHTAKNIMIVATRNPKAALNDSNILNKIARAKHHFGISEHYLEKLLN